MKRHAMICRIALLTTWLISAADVAWSQEPQAAATGVMKHEYVGFQECVRCHYRPAPFDSTEWVSLKEAEIWLREDKHARAYAVLDGERSRQMGRILQHPLGWDDDDVRTKQACLSCHANWHEGAPKPEVRSLEFGVSCQSCHGPGKDYLEPHRNESWRAKSSAEKEALGMVDVRNPLKRGQQCLSCHVGNLAEGKILTHEMYAAGHPPLPGIELETFCQAMPPHWQPPGQKPEKSRELLNISPEKSSQTSQVVLGSVLSLRASLYLFSGHLAAHPDQGADFAQFDCFACHHELQSPSWRQQRGYAGAPGRLQPRSWPMALLKSGILEPLGDAESAELYRQATTDLAQFYGILDKRPLGDARRMGDPDKSGTLSYKLVTSLDELAARLAARHYTHAETLSILRHVAASASQNVHDYDSARQIAWAMRALYRGLPTQHARHSEIETVFSTLNSDLRLELPAAPKWTFGEEQVRAGLKASDAPPTGIEQALGANLAAVNQYEPASVQQQFKKLSELLSIE